MSEQHPLICITDDSNEERLLLKLLLEDSFNIIEASSGEECLEIVEKQTPDLFLLDINMPGINGYSVCEALRKRPETKSSPIIFVSGLDSVQERLEGFESGGDEYIIKPIDPTDLLEKVHHYTDNIKRLKQSANQANDAMKVAMEAMTVSSELGQIVEFIKKGQVLNSAEEIGQAMLDITREFQLNSAVMVHLDAKRYFFGCTLDSLEAKFLEKVENSKERILNLRVRTVVCDENLVLLIKDMPLDDENRVGRLKDHLAVLMDIGSGFLENIKAQLRIKEVRKNFLNEIIAISEKQIKLTSNKIKHHGQTSTGIMQGMLSELENMLFSLGLEEDQEKKLMQLANVASLQLDDLNESTNDLDSELGVILESLYNFLASEDK